jgi:hypothetical protein
MKKAEREIRDQVEIEQILSSSRIIHVAFHDDPFPYILPFNYGYKDGYIYIHSALEGKKTDLIRKNNRVGFQVDIETEIVPAEKACGWSTKYRSVVGTGFAELLTDPAEKKDSLDIIMVQHGEQDKNQYADNSLDKMLIIRIRMHQCKGKRA